MMMQHLIRPARQDPIFNSDLDNIVGNQPMASLYRHKVALEARCEIGR